MSQDALALSIFSYTLRSPTFPFYSTLKSPNPSSLCTVVCIIAAALLYHSDFWWAADIIGLLEDAEDHDVSSHTGLVGLLCLRGLLDVTCPQKQTTPHLAYSPHAAICLA